MSEQTTEKTDFGHPSEHCYSCLDYLNHRQNSLPLLIATKAKREGRPGREVFEEYMTADLASSESSGSAGTPGGAS